MNFATLLRRSLLPGIFCAATLAAHAQNVGVGTLNPSEKLDVVGGNLKLSTSGSRLIFPDGTAQGTAASGTGFIVNGTASQANSSFNVSGSGTVGSLNVGGTSLINAQGAYLQWNRSGGTGETWLLNQKGQGSGGIYFGATDAVSSGSNTLTEWARFDASGNLGLGTSPSQKLDVAGNASVRGNAYVNGSLGTVLNGQDRPLITRGYDAFASGSYQGAGRWGLFMEPGRLTFGIPAIDDRHFQWVRYNDNSSIASTLMFLSQAGNLGIGTASPAAGLHIDRPESGNGTALGVLLSGGTSGNPSIELRGDGKSPYIDFVENTNLDYSTRLLSLAGTLNLFYGGAAGSKPAYIFSVAGGIQATAVNTTSDQRFKQDIRPLTGALARVLALRGVRYRWNTLGVQRGGTAGAEQVGVLAQEVEKIYPELVSTGADGYKAVNYAQLTPVLIEALKEQQAQIEALRTEAATAKAQAAQATAALTTFEDRLRRLEAGGAQAQR